MDTKISAKRLKSGWRILLFLLVFWSLTALVFVIKPLFGALTKREFLQWYSPVIVGVLAVAATLAVWVARKYLDKRSFMSLGLKGRGRAWADVFFGFGLSGFMAIVFLGVSLAFGFVEITSVGTHFTAGTAADAQVFGPWFASLGWGALGLLLLEHILVGYWEELVFRGYLLRNLTQGTGLKTAILISCVLYGLIHAANPNAGWVSTLIIVVFGFLRIYGVLVTKLLWLSIGMHIGWNFFQGPLLGFGASGHAKPSVLELTLTGPDWLSGGAFGPEGSILILPILLGALWIMRWWANRTYSDAPLAEVYGKEVFQ